MGERVPSGACQAMTLAARGTCAHLLPEPSPESRPAGGTARGQTRAEREAPALPDDQHAVAARDQFPDHGRSGQLPGDEQPA